MKRATGRDASPPLVGIEAVCAGLPSGTSVRVLDLARGA